MTLKRRLAGAFGATLLGPIVTIFVQLINIPIMLHYWGAHLYGEWLLISTIPAYLLLTDLGFGSVAGSDMTIRVHAGDRQGALETFQSIFVLVISVSILGGASLSAIVFLMPMHRLLHLSAISLQDTRTTLLFLCLNCLVILQWGVVTAAYRCAGRYALGMLCVNIIRFLEGISFLILLVWHAGPVQLSMVMLAISVIGTCGLMILKRRLIPWLPLGTRQARWQRVRQLWKPAIAYLAFPTGNAISMQGMTTMVGLLLGPLAVAVFNPMRTLSRPIFQLTDAVKNSVWQELSAAFGQQNFDLTRRLHRSACQISIALALVVSIALAITGERIFAIWTHGRIVMDVTSFYILLAVGLVNSLWNASSAVAMAANRHQRLAIVYLACTSCSLLVGYPLIRNYGLNGAGIALLLCEFGMSAYVIHLSNKLLSDQWSQFAISMIDTTHLRVLREKFLRRVG